MTEAEIEEHKKKIDQMSQEELGSLIRFAPVGHIYFRTDNPLYKYIGERFKGFNPELSKKIGWDR